MAIRLTFSNRPENLKLLLESIHKWAQERNLSGPRRAGLEAVAQEIFHYLISQVYRPGQPGSIAVELEEKGPRLRLTFEDDAPPHDPPNFSGLAASGPPPGPAAPDRGRVPQVAESLIYYRTSDRKNRLVVFLSL